MLAYVGLLLKLKVKVRLVLPGDCREHSLLQWKFISIPLVIPWITHLHISCSRSPGCLQLCVKSFSACSWGLVPNLRVWRSLHLPPDLSSWLPLAVALLFSNCGANLHLRMFEHSTVTGIKVKILDDLSHCVPVSGFVFVCMCGSVFGVALVFKNVFCCVVCFEWREFD